MTMRWPWRASRRPCARSWPPKACGCPWATACTRRSRRRPEWSAWRRNGLGVEAPPRGDVGLVGLGRQPRPLQPEPVDGPHEDRGDERLREPLLVGGDDVPRRPRRRGRGQGGVVGADVVVPALPLVDVAGVERPLALGRVEPREEAPLLLGARDVQEELDDRRAVAVEVALEGVDVLVAALPEPGRRRAVGQPLLGQPLRVHPERDDLLVVRAVEDADPPALRRRLGDAPQKRVVELLRGRLLEADDLDALRVDARHDVADGAVLSGGVHRLEDDEQRAAVAGPQQLLGLGELRDVVGEHLPRLGFELDLGEVLVVGAAEPAGVARRQRGGRARRNDDVVEHALRAGHPRTIPSVAPDGAGSGSRIMRDALNRPSRPARIGISSATCSARGRASVLMAMISSCTAGDWPATSSSRRELDITWASFSSTSATRSFCAGASTSLSLAMWVNVNESVASMIAPANARPKDRPNDPPAEFTPAASLTRSSEIGDKV